jgi:hypothetical protein
MNELTRQRSRYRLLALILTIAGLLLLFRYTLISFASHAELSVNVEHQPAIMPAVYKVYANENALNGKYSLFKMLVTNKGNVTARNVDVSFQIPNYIGWTSVMKVPAILPGESVVINCYPDFPDRIVDKTTSSNEKVSIKIKGSNISDVDEDFNIEMKGRNEFLYTCVSTDEIRTNADVFDNSDLLSCLITPEDPIIKYYTQKIQEKILKGEDASVAMKDDEGVRFMKGIYTATLISHMVYSGTSGVPEKYEDVSTSVQSIRWPREVVTGKTGLCIELSLLYASVMADAGMDPVIFLLPGHAFPGFKMNGNYYAIEATGIGGEGLGNRMTTDQAFETGMKELQEFYQNVKAGDDRYRILDVRDAISNGAVAVELKDDPYLRQKIDEIAQAFNTGDQGTAYGYQNNPQADNGYAQYQGDVNFSYPNDWVLVPRTTSTMQQVKEIIADRSNMAAVTVYQFDGYNDPQTAMEAMKAYVEQNSGTIQYTAASQSLNGYMLYDGQTKYSNTEPANWVAALKVTTSGVVGIAVAVYASAGSQYQSVLLNILKSLR